MEHSYDVLKSKSVGKILDIATGYGEFLIFLTKNVKNFSDAIGIDSEEKIIEFAKKKCEDEKISFLKMDAKNLEFDDESFDIVSISNSLHHFNDVEKVLSEMKRVLRKDGFFIISEMFQHVNERETQKIHTDFHHWSAKIDAKMGRIHNLTYTKQGLIDVANSLNLREINIEEWSGNDENAKNEKIKEQLQKAFESIVGRIQEFPDVKEIEEERKEILRRLDKFGFASSSRVEIICQK